MCTCSIFVCTHKNNDMSTLLGHAHTYIPTDRQTDTQAYVHKSIQTYSYTYTWLHMCDVSPLWGGGWGGTRGGWIIYIYIYIYLSYPSSFHIPSQKMYLVNIFTYIYHTQLPIRVNISSSLSGNVVFVGAFFEGFFSAMKNPMVKLALHRVALPGPCR